MARIEDNVSLFDFCDVATEIALVEKIEEPKEVPQGYHVLHRVACRDYDTECNMKLYKDLPIQLRRHLAGHDLVEDFDDFLEDHPDTAFVAFETHTCDARERRGRERQRNKDVTTPPHESVQIVSKELSATLKHISQFDAGDEAVAIPARFKSRGTSEDIYAPPVVEEADSHTLVFLYHHRQKLRDILQDQPHRKDIAALLNYLSNEASCKDWFKQCDDEFGQGLVSRETVGALTYLNDTVVMQITVPGKPSEFEACVVGDFNSYSTPDTVGLYCWRWLYDGTKLVREDRWVKEITTPEKGTVAITSLPVYPLKYATEDLKALLLEKGRKFWGLRHGGLVEYEGYDYDEEDEEPRGRFMIDYKAYNRNRSRSPVRQPLGLYTWPNEVDKDAELTDELAMVAPPYVNAYCMEKREWCRLYSDKIVPVQWKTSESVVLEPETRETLTSLVEAHSSVNSSTSRKSGKGKKGLSILLHGPTGCGKNKTVEYLAESAHMPLITFKTGRDLSPDPHILENILRDTSSLIEPWNCILFIDDAHGILGKDLHKQSEGCHCIWSAVLNLLETFPGILILACNSSYVPLKNIDKAIKSRIRVTVQLPTLGFEARKEIWHGVLQAEYTQLQKMDIGLADGIISKLAGADLDGRQIHNAFETAKQLAEHTGQPLSSELLETAVDAVIGMGEGDEEEE